MEDVKRGKRRKRKKDKMEVEICRSPRFFPSPNNYVVLALLNLLFHVQRISATMDNVWTERHIENGIFIEQYVLFETRHCEKGTAVSAQTATCHAIHSK